MQQLAPPGNVESIERSSTYYGERKEGSNFCWWYAVGSAGFKILASKDAKKVYTQTTAAVLRMKDCTTVSYTHLPWRKLWPVVTWSMKSLMPS